MLVILDSINVKGMIEMLEALFSGFLVVLRRSFEGHLNTIHDLKRFCALHNSVIRSCLKKDCEYEVIIEGLKSRSPPLILAPISKV